MVDQSICDEKCAHNVNDDSHSVENDMASMRLAAKVQTHTWLGDTFGVERCSCLRQVYHRSEQEM